MSALPARLLRPLPLAVMFLLGLWVGGAFSSRAPRGPASPEPAGARPEAAVWTCSMHPQIRRSGPGQCPICAMDLIPVRQDEPAGGGGPRTLALTAASAALADIVTAPVERREVAHRISMVGKVAYDETRLAYLTAWVPGRLDRLFVDYTGVSVRAGDHMVEIYSPKLFSAQQELLQAIHTAGQLEETPLSTLREASAATVRSAREKLRLLGLSDEQVEEVVRSGRPDDHVTILAPIGGIVVHKNALEGMYVDEGTRVYTIADLTKLWVNLQAYESDLAWLRYGQDVEFQVAAWPGESFHGRIAFIDPVLDDRTRTIRVRLNVRNEGGRLKPDMFVRAQAQAILTPSGKVVDPDLANKWMCPMHPEIQGEGPGACPECGMDLVPAAELGFVARGEDRPPLVIPATAPLVTGRRAVVYVKLPDSEQPTFEGREITLGPRAGDWYVVHNGLREGEEVVIQGNFKIDSELQIQARPSMMSPEGGAPPPGHHHGGGPAPQAPSAQDPANPDPGAAAAVQAPPAFREQLAALVSAYLETQAALAADREDESRRAAASLEAALETVDMALLEGPAHGAWMDRLLPLQRAVARIAAASALADRREAFADLSTALLGVLESFGPPAGAGLGVFHCPMAREGAGADWLQTGAETRNPYFGSSMLRCGDRVRMLAERP